MQSTTTEATATLADRGPMRVDIKRVAFVRVLGLCAGRSVRTACATSIVEQSAPSTPSHTDNGDPLFRPAVREGLDPEALIELLTAFTTGGLLALWANDLEPQRALDERDRRASFSRIRLGGCRRTRPRRSASSSTASDVERSSGRRSGRR